MEIHSLLRYAEHEVLSSIRLQGKVLDLGGDRRSTYQHLFKGDFEFTVVNMNEKSEPDLVHDLERPLPLPDASFDTALLINVLEHIYEYRQLLSEATRVVKPGGSVIIAVPFLFPVHPSPRDFWRFTEEALRRECESAGLSVESITALGSGVFAARYVLLDRLMPGPIRWVGAVFAAPLIQGLDAFFVGIARILRKKYVRADYPLGYCLVAKK